MATMADLCNTRPAVGEGVPTGRGIWRLVVQVAAASGAVWGAEYGYVCGSPTVWSDGWEWVDITDAVRGFTYQRGMGSVADRPRVGTCAIELDNNAGDWSTWQRLTYPYLDVGSVVRIVVDSQVGDTMDSDWWPRFTGRVEAIDELTTDLDADRRVIITLAETISDLARVDDIAINGSDGTDETAIIQRFARLVDRAGWPFPTDGLSADATYIWDHDTDVYQHVLFQPTNYAQNRLTELYLTADSATIHVFTDRNGGLRIASAWSPAMEPTLYYFGEISTTAARWVVPWHDLAVTADEEGIVTDAQIAPVGGTVSEYRIPGKTGRVTYQRNDLIYIDVPAYTIGAHIAERIVEDIRNYQQTQRAVVRLDVLTDDVVWDGIMGTDILQSTIVFREMTRFGGTDARQLTGYVMAETHKVTPLTNGSVVWAAEYLLHVTDNDPFTDYP